MRRSRTGTTLLELMVYSLLLGFLMTGVYAAFAISRTYYDSAQGSTQAQQEALKAINGVSAALSDSRASSLQAGPSPGGIAMLSAHPLSQTNFAHDSASGQVLWQQWVLIYLDSSTRELVRKAMAYAAPQLAPVTLTPDTLLAATGANVSRRVLARNITLFSPALSPSPSPLAGTVTVTVSACVPSMRFGENQVNVTSQVNVRQ